MSRRPRTAEDDASFKGMGLAIRHIREQRGMGREELAEKIEEGPVILAKLERGEVDADWATLRVVAHALSIPLDALMNLAEEHAPGPGGEAWRKRTWDIEAKRSERRRDDHSRSPYTSSEGCAG